MRHHNREEFEIYGYCTSQDDGSAMRRQILSYFNKAKSIKKLNDENAAKLIRNDEIDILVDLNGLTEGFRLGILARKPAPIQISYLAFPGTSGGRFIDYIIADNYVIPPSNEHFYPEKIIKLEPT